MTSDALQPGTLLGEDYRIERTLGQGGFGIVYLATDLALQRTVAVKEFLPSQWAGRGEGTAIGLREAAHQDLFLRGRQAFLHEARLLAQFDHPSLVRVYRFWEENHTAYMAMSYFEGPTLKAARDAMPRPPDETWLRESLLIPLLGALEVLHERGCVHRDVSPGNIVMASDGRPVLLDFGSARKVTGDMTQPLTTVLNPAYAAIEQYAEGSTLSQGPWTDLYGLAGVAYFALGGRPPLPATVRAVNDGATMPAAELARTITSVFPSRRYGAPFLEAIDRAMSLKPQERPQSAAEWRQALQRPHVQPDVLVEPPRSARMGSPEAAAENAAALDEEARAIKSIVDNALAFLTETPARGRARETRIEPVMPPAPSLPPVPAPTVEAVALAVPLTAPAPMPVEDAVQEVEQKVEQEVVQEAVPAPVAPQPAVVEAAVPPEVPSPSLDHFSLARPEPEESLAPQPLPDEVAQIRPSEPDSGAEPFAPARRRWRHAAGWIGGVLAAGVAVAAVMQWHPAIEEEAAAPAPKVVAEAPPVTPVAPPTTRAEAPVPAPAPAVVAAAVEPAASAAEVAAAPPPAAVEPPKPQPAPAPTKVAAAPRPVHKAVAAATPRKPPAPVARTSTSGTQGAKAAAATKTAKAPADPHAACSGKSNFSLYYCMRAQCQQPRFSASASCVRLRETGDVS